jgi:thioredoxin reductase
MRRTDVSGVWAAGNLLDLGAIVSASAGMGVTAATAVNADLVAEDVAAAVARHG